MYGTWLHIVFGLTQHAGLAEDVLDHRHNTRTVYMNPSFLSLLEHELSGTPHVSDGSIPRTPCLHEEMKADTAPFIGI